MKKAAVLCLALLFAFFAHGCELNNKSSASYASNNNINSTDPNTLPKLPDVPVTYNLLTVTSIEYKYSDSTDHNYYITFKNDSSITMLETSRLEYECYDKNDRLVISSEVWIKETGAGESCTIKMKVDIKKDISKIVFTGSVIRT